MTSTEKSRTTIALITGAGREGGLGHEVARQLAAKGHHVILTARDLSQVEPLADAINAEGLSASALQLDLTDEDSVTTAVRAVASEHGRLDVLVNNAVMMVPSAVSAAEKDMGELSREFETNVVGTWRVTKHFFPLLEAGGHGRVVNVSSGAGSFWDPDYGLVNFLGLAMGDFGDMPITAYAITKTALNALTITMAKDFRAGRILVNSVCPDVTASRGPGWGRPVADSALGVVWAATLPDDGPTGLFFRDGKQLPW